MGGVGTGKTMLLGALHRFFRVHLRDEVLGCGDVVYGSFLCSASKLAKFDDESQRIAATASVLLVDDVGVEPAVVSSYGTTSTPLVDVLCERYERRRPTVISTNLNAEALRERYGERIHDRMCEVYARIPFNFTSFRQP
jgi:DNA replication protein DnaC